MRNLRLFILKNYFFFLFLVFELVSLSLYVSYNDFQRATFVNSSNEWVGYIMEKKSEITDYMNLKDANEQLLMENAKLRNMLKESHFQIHKGEILIKDSSLQLQYVYLPAKVINNTVSLRDNFLTLNRGTEDGVRKDMGVTNGFSIVGFVKDVSAHYCTVVSVLNKNFVLSVKIKTTNDHGYIKWEGSDDETVVLNGITVDAPVKVGDTVVTRGASARFPENINVGVVKEVNQKPGSMHHHIVVSLTTDFSSVYNVYVLDNRFREEQKALEDSLTIQPK